MDELCISKKQNLWLWTAVSRYTTTCGGLSTGQVLACASADRGWKTAAKVHGALPERYRRRTVYTDGYGAYSALFAPWQHRLCQRYDGGTCTVEGVNNSLRHRCSFLVRRHCGPRCGQGLRQRLAFAVAAHNRACQKRWNKKQAKSTQSGE